MKFLLYSAKTLGLLWAFGAIVLLAILISATPAQSVSEARQLSIIIGDVGIGIISALIAIASILQSANAGKSQATSDRPEERQNMKDMSGVY